MVWSFVKYRITVLIGAACILSMLQVPAFAAVSSITDMPYPRVGMCSAKIENTIYFIGGAQNVQGRNFDNFRGTSTVQAYNFETGEWETNIASLETPRVFACAVALDDSIYVMGGVDSLGNVLNSVEVYSPESNSWHYADSMKFARTGAAATAFDGDVLVFGGGDSSSTLQREVEAYNPDKGIWQVLPQPTLFGRAFHHVVKVGDAVYIFGGIGAGATVGPIGIIEKYVPFEGVVSLSLTWSNPRMLFGTVVKDDSVFVISGFGASANGNGYSANVEVFDLKNSDSISVSEVNIPPLQYPRRGFVATLGNDGTIYMFGGQSYDYKKGQFPIPTVSEIGTVAATVVQNEYSTIPNGFSLAQNYPNPFNPTTNITFNVPAPGGYVSLNVYNMLGEKVRTLVDGYMQAGSHAAVFDGANLPSGAYIYSLETKKGSIYRKMVLIK